MNILYTLNSGDPGGMEQHVLDLTLGMTQKGHNVFVWCCEGQITNWYSEVGATVSVEPVHWDIDPSYIFKLYKFLKQNHIDVVHSHELKASINSLIAAFFARTKVRITHVHTPISEWRISTLKKYLDIFVYSFAVALFSSVEIALTGSRKKVKIKEGIPTNKLRVIPNGVEIAKFDISSEQKQENRRDILSRHSISPEKKIIGLVGRTTIEKGHCILLEAFYEFLKKSAEPHMYHLLFAGGGALEEELNAKAQELGISEKVTVTGRFEANMLVKYYSAIDLFVFPSLAEGFGIVLIEAISSKLPLVSSDLPVLKEVAGDTISYFPVGQKNRLAELILDYTKNEESWIRNIDKAYDRVSRLYSMEKFISNYENLYSELLN